jgi:hypothetical protein
MDLDVTNPNEPDSERALDTAGDVEALIGGSYYRWFNATQSIDAPDWQHGTPGFILTTLAFQNSVPWTNFGMWAFTRIPREAFITDVSHFYYPNLWWAWRGCYQALSALAYGSIALEDPIVARAIGDEGMIRDRAYARFVQGLAHGTIALLYARGFVVDEVNPPDQPHELIGYDALMERALAYFDEAIAIAASGSFTIPYSWMQADLDADGLIRLAYSYKARFRAQVARTVAERVAVDWSAVIADVDEGIREDHTIDMDREAGWISQVLALAYPGWNQLPYFIYGMADQSGAVSEWYTLPLTIEQAAGEPAKGYLLPDGRPVLIVTPDLRFPQGSTIEEQRVSEGRYFRILAPIEEAGGPMTTLTLPSRGVWSWSLYKSSYGRGFDYWGLAQYVQPEMTLAEARLLKAEGLYRLGDLAGAAAIVNETRMAAGLNQIDPSGTNSSCVPKLPNGECGDLWEMLKWEKRMETVFTGIATAEWFFDGRGWGDLWKDTPLQLPVPCTELEVLGLTPCPTFGGPGGEMSAPVSTYEFPFER